jgi:tRNA(adenine34) deaminase
MKTLDSDEQFMNLALQEAQKSQELNEVPVGAIIVMNGEVISKSHNKSISQNDPTSHAEINALRNAAKKVGNYRLTGATLYATLEPCAMCYGAIVHARIPRLVFGAYDPKTGVCGSSIKLHEQECFNHTPEIKGGVLEIDCSLILKDFFKGRRN